MNSEALKELRLQVLTLSDVERAELAHDLIVSLDTPPESGVDQAWNDEIVRRIEQVESGDIELLSRDEFRRKLQEKVGYR